MQPIVNSTKTIVWLERAIVFVLLNGRKMGTLIPHHVIISSKLNDQNLMRCDIKSIILKF